MATADLAGLISLASKLEPISGIAFVLNMAYVGLPRFRYRQDIRQQVTEEMGDLAKPDDVPPNIKKMALYKSVVRLSSLGEYDRKLFEKTNHNADLTGAWSSLYQWWFECHQDRFFIISAAIVSAVLIMVGAAHEVGSLGWLSSAFSSKYIVYWLCFITALQLLPVISILIGRYVTAEALKFAKKNIEDIKAAMQRDVASIDVKQPSQNMQVPKFLPPVIE